MSVKGQLGHDYQHLELAPMVQDTTKGIHLVLVLCVHQTDRYRQPSVEGTQHKHAHMFSS